MKKQKKIIVSMSGGVDSSVSAWILKKMGYQVEGLFMKNWEEDDNSQYCNAKKDLNDAKSICKILNINLHTVNFSAEYWDNVFVKFLSAYKLGLTPNPDVLCNKEIKFKVFLDFAINRLNANLIATGHYVRLKKINNYFHLMKGIDKKKDQSYFLYSINKKILKYCVFPLGNMTKVKVRNIAFNLGFSNAYKKSSTGICFIGKRNFKHFISRYISSKPGLILSTKGEKLGYHNGLHYYTIGQRRGLNIGGNKINEPWYVVSKKVKENTLIVSQGKNNVNLFFLGLVAHKLNWMSNFQIINGKIRCSAKVRYRTPDFECFVIFTNNKDQVKVIFNKPINIAISPGQSVVFYNKEICLGGGIIKYSISANNSLIS